MDGCVRSSDHKAKAHDQDQGLRIGNRGFIQPLSHDIASSSPQAVVTDMAQPNVQFPVDFRDIFLWGRELTFAVKKRLKGKPGWYERYVVLMQEIDSGELSGDDFILLLEAIIDFFHPFPDLLELFADLVGKATYGLISFGSAPNPDDPYISVVTVILHGEKHTLHKLVHTDLRDLIGIRRTSLEDELEADPPGSHFMFRWLKEVDTACGGDSDVLRQLAEAMRSAEPEPEQILEGVRVALQNVVDGPHLCQKLASAILNWRPALQVPYKMSSTQLLYVGALLISARASRSTIATRLTLMAMPATTAKSASMKAAPLQMYRSSDGYQLLASRSTGDEGKVE
ncbi:hypothetical protein NMY22_g3180 [Coprinellus aureogranulatus]|nr:hypothetical protein NMY22_g3180 [Coprinellus aureogranulatus]